MVVVKDINKLKQDIISSGYNYTELARNIGVSKTTISQILTGTRNPSPKNAVKICEQLKRQFNHYFFIKSIHKSEQ